MAEAPVVEKVASDAKNTLKACQQRFCELVTQDITRRVLVDFAV